MLDREGSAFEDVNGISGEDGVFTIIKKQRVDPLEDRTKKDMLSKK